MWLADTGLRSLCWLGERILIYILSPVVLVVVATEGGECSCNNNDDEEDTTCCRRRRCVATSLRQESAAVVVSCCIVVAGWRASLVRRDSDCEFWAGTRQTPPGQEEK